MAAYLGQSLFKDNCRAADERTRALLGCTREKPEYQWLDIYGHTVKGCPRCEVDRTPEVYAYLRWYRFFEMGHMPYPGGLAEQPALLVEAFEIIGEVYGRRKQA